jgi:hypothetical protein
MDKRQTRSVDFKSVLYVLNILDKIICDERKGIIYTSHIYFGLLHACEMSRLSRTVTKFVTII